MGLTRVLLALAASVTLAFGGTAQAQSASPSTVPPKASPGTSPSVSALEEVIVTAQRRSENLQSVPLSVSAVTAEVAETFQVHSNEALAYLTPGLTFVRAPNSASPFLRGVGFNSGTPGNEPGVAYYVDGVYLPSPATTIQSFSANLDHIEVLKGPQGTLYGRNAAGGVIQIVTVDPQPKRRFDASVGYASYNTLSGQIYGSTGLTEALAADISLYYDKQGDGWGTNLTTGADAYRSHEYAARTKWVWRPSDDAKLTFSADYADLQSELGASFGLQPGAISSKGVAKAGGFFDTQSGRNPLTGEPPGIRTRVGGVSAKAEYDLPWAHFMSLTAYRKYDSTVTVDSDATPLTVSQSIQYQRGRTFSQEFQLLSQAGSKLKWVAGLFLFDDDQGEFPFVNARPAVSSSVSRQRVFSWAPFAEATYPIFDRTRLTLGLRYTSDRKHMTGALLNAANVVTTTIDAKKDADKVTYKVTLDHDFAEDILGYVTASRGFRSGNFNNTNPTAAPTRPQTIDAVEVGLKSQFLDRRLRINLAAYDYRLKDMVVQALPNGVPIQSNAAGASIKGLDFDLSAVPMDRLTLSLSGSFLDAKFTDYANAQFFFPCASAPANPACAGNAVLGGVLQGFFSGVGNATGNPLPYTEKTAVTGEAEYRFPAPGGGEMRLSTAVSYHSGFYFNVQRFRRQDSYTNLDIAARWTSEDRTWDVLMWGRNLLDNEVPSNGTLQNLSYVYSVTAPLTYGVKVEYHY